VSAKPPGAVDAPRGRASAFGLPGRIQAPNSKPRSIALVGLGNGGAAIARALSAEGLPNLDVHVLAKSAAGDNTVAAIQAGGGDLQRALTSADMIFMVACRGDDVGLAPVVSGIAHSRNHPVTALYIMPSDAIVSATEDETLKTLRSSVEMLVVVSDQSYVPAMIAALGS
jgi:cell division GTPase FtsZ